jgi:hypothetical protein
MVWNDLVAAPVVSKARINSYFEKAGLQSDITVSKLQTEEGINVRYHELSDIKNYEACSELLNLLTM